MVPSSAVTIGRWISCGCATIVSSHWVRCSASIGYDARPTYIDPWLRTYDEVWAAAGHPAAVFSTTFDELVAMTGAVETDVE